MNSVLTNITYIFRMLSEEEAGERLEDADEDGDGKVTWKEYISDAYGLDDDDTLPIGDENEQVRFIVNTGEFKNQNWVYLLVLTC